METDPGGARLRELRHEAVHGIDHQVDVDRRGDAVLAQGLADERPDREVRDVVVVHHVEVDPVGAGREHRVDFVTETGEVGRQDGGGDDGVLHGALLYRNA